MEIRRGFDTSILLLSVVLTCLGVVMVYSASSIMAEKRFADGFFFLKRQGTFALVGFLVMIIAMQIDYRHLKKVAAPMFIASILLLGAVLGHEPPAVELLNRSDEPVLAFSLSVAGESVTGGSLPVGALDRHLVPVRHEGAIHLELEFAGGRRTRVEAGWFSPGQANPARIAIESPDSVTVAAW